MAREAFKLEESKQPKPESFYELEKVIPAQRGKVSLKPVSKNANPEDQKAM